MHPITHFIQFPCSTTDVIGLLLSLGSSTRGSVTKRGKVNTALGARRGRQSSCFKSCFLVPISIHFFRSRCCRTDNSLVCGIQGDAKQNWNLFTDCIAFPPVLYIFLVPSLCLFVWMCQELCFSPSFVKIMLLIPSPPVPLCNFWPPEPCLS